jgi:hypothetical protein
VSSAILIVNGISFAIMTMFFTTIGSLADYGNWNKWILITATGKLRQASSRIKLTTSDMLGISIRLDGNHLRFSMASRHRSLPPRIHLIRCHLGVLCVRLPPTG